MEQHIQILHLEDNALDAELIQAALDSASIPCQVTRVQTSGEFSAALQKGGYDLILADYQLPSYDGLSALDLAQSQYPDIPFIFVSGTLGEDAAINALTKGAIDYVTKQKLPRLAPAVTRALREAEDRMQRKHAEDALQKNNALLERIFSSTEFLIAYLDADFNFIRVNRAYAEADEQIPEFFVGKNHFSLYPDPENEAKFKEVVETGEPYIVFAKPFVYPEHPERGITYWDWTLQPIKETDNRVSGLVFSLVDVTQREKAINAQRESDALYRSLVEQASDGIFVADPSGKFIDVNPSGCAMLGYTREEILNMSMKTLAGPGSLPHTPVRLSEIKVGETFTAERILIAKNGTSLTVESNGTKLDNGNLLGIVRDITERKRHELERESIIKVSTTLRQATTKSDILNVILDQLMDLFKADGAVLVLPDPQTRGFVDEMGRGPVGERMVGLSIPPDTGVCNWVIKNRQPYLNNRADLDTIFYRPDLLGDSHCLAAVPLIAQEQTIGALWIVCHANISEQDLGLLTAIADIAANAIHRVTLHEQTEQQLHHLLALHQIDIAISANFDLNVTLNIILKNVKDELQVDAASVLLLNTVTHTLDYAAGVGFRTHNIENSHVRLGYGYAGRAAQTYRTVFSNDLTQAPGTFSRSSLLAAEEFVSHYATPLIVKGQVKGVLEVFHRKTFDTDQEWIDYFETLATQAAIAIENASLFENLQRSNLELMIAYDATIEGWSRALDLRDRETEGHTQRVTEMALELAEKLGMSDAEKTDLRRGALLHDIGKMGVPDSILLKPGPLSDAEWEWMRKHPVYAFEMLSPIPYLKRALDIPYCHHEKWDGSGYPRGLKGEAIPLSARLFSIVDVFDALTSNRPYRAAWSHAKVSRYIQEQSGMSFDPHIVQIFLKDMD